MLEKQETICKISCKWRPCHNSSKITEFFLMWKTWYSLSLSGRKIPHRNQKRFIWSCCLRRQPYTCLWGHTTVQWAIAKPTQLYCVGKQLSSGRLEVQCELLRWTPSNHDGVTVPHTTGELVGNTAIQNEIPAEAKIVCNEDTYKKLRGFLQLWPKLFHVPQGITHCW